MKALSVISALVLLLSFSSCQRSNGDNSNNTAVQNQQTAASGTWRVSSFTEPGDDKTSDFTGYSFSFNNGAITAVNSGITKNGTLTITSTKFIIDLGPKDNTNKPLGELTDDWRIISISGTEIKLTDDNTTSQEFVTFTKN